MPPLVLNLSDIHTRRNAEGVKDDINGSAVRQERHILLTANFGDNALVAVATAHFIADRNLAFLGDIDADLLIDAGSHFVVIVASKGIDGDDLAAFAVRYSKRRIADFASLFTEDSA